MSNITDILICQQYALNNDGILIDTVYVNNKVPLTWKHNKCGYVWKACWNSITAMNSWCPKCAKNIRLSISTIQEFIATKNGHLISIEYKNNHTPLEIQCNVCATNWKATWNDIYSKQSWCPSCQTLKSEKECIRIAENILNISLVKKRIYYEDANNIKYRLEFDGYNEEHKIVVEYNGRQHYEYVSKFHDKPGEGLEIQQERDNRKRTYCKENNITLIEVPYYENNNMSRFILKTKQTLHIKPH